MGTPQDSLAAKVEEPSRDVLRRLDSFVQAPHVRFGMIVATAALVVLTFFGFVYPAPLAILFLGAVLGSLSALTAMGIVLIYRANRIVNFAQGDLGALAGVLTVSLIGGPRWGFYPAMLAGLAAGLALGAVIEVVFVRRFAKAPRLILTVATLGIAQLCLVGQLGIPTLFGFDLAPQDFPTPLDFTFTWEPVTFRGNHLLAIMLVPLAAVGLGAFFRYTRAGVAVRASAESTDRALLLGIPVRRLGTLVWVLAAGLSALAAILRAPIVGVSIGSVLGPALLLRALAAAVIGRMENLWVTFAAAVALGMVEQAVVWHTGRTLIADAVLFIIIIGALLFQQRGAVSRAVERGASSWQSISEVRPVPPELGRLWEVRLVRVGLVVAVLGLGLLLPSFVSTREVNLASYGIILAILAISLVILTGWAGQISLGQWAFAGFGGAIAGTLAQKGLDLPFTLLFAGLTGAVISTVIGLPALRIRGPFLAVATFALALATSSFFLNPEFSAFSWYLPDRGERIVRPFLLGKFDLESETPFYFLTLLILLGVLASVGSLRHSNIGRALIAARDNERAAEAFGVNLMRARLTGFALSGFFAAVAGGLFVYHQHGMFRNALRPEESIALFSIVVFGGLGSITGALLGVAWFQVIDHFVASALWRLFTTGAGLLVVLWILPGGLGQVFYWVRDVSLRALARHKQIVVPSLVADVRTADQEEDPTPRVSRPAAADDLLVCRGLDVAYGKTQVLFNVDFTVQQGELLALLGTNGAGKSTLLGAVAGLVKPTSGSITFDGQDITGMAADRVAANGVVMAPGGKGVFPTLTVAENLDLAGWLFRDEGERLQAEKEEVLTRFPQLRERWDQKAGNLSGGEQQMLMLGQVFLARPKILLIDELSLGLAPIIVEQLLEIVREIHRRGTTVVLVEQSVNIATTLADRAVFMEKGEVRFDGPTKELLERPDVLRAVFLQGTSAATSEVAPADAEERAPRPQFVETCRHCGTTHAEILSTSDLSVTFGGVRAVDGVSVSVRAGEILGLIGPNGAGKTTFFDLVSGFITATTGRVELAGKDVTAMSPDARATLGLGRSFQDARLFPSMTVVENLAIALGRHHDGVHPLSAALALPSARVSEEEIHDRVEELIELMHLEAFANKFVAELSTGSRRVVDLACCLAHEPSVLLLDEPSSGIAQRETEALAPLLLDIRERTGAALLVIEHDMPLITSVSDRLVALDLGQLIAVGEPQSVINDERVVASYLGTSVEAVHRSGAGSRARAARAGRRVLTASRVGKR